MKYFFCTYFDENFLPRGLTLIESLKKHAGDFKIFILCLDDKTQRYFTENPESYIQPIKLTDLENADPELAASKENRSRVEYFFTLSPCLPLYILNTFPEGDHITYLDSDLYFFSSPQPMYEELGSKSIYIIPHRFPPHLKHLEAYGVYNVGCQIFRNDPAGKKCLEHWRMQCIDWCYDIPEKDRFGDQKYLDQWPVIFKDNVALSRHPGANLAPWNFSNYKLTLKEGKVKVNQEDLIFYHFQRLRFIGERLVTHGIDVYKSEPDRILKNHVYAPYLGSLIRRNQYFSRKSDTIGRFAKKYTFKEKRQLLKHGYTFFYINDRWCFRFKWNRWFF
jgi:hypothetical protein